MSTRRHGVRDGFFDGTTAWNLTTNPGGGTGVGPGAVSKQAMIGRSGDNFSFYISVAGTPGFTTTWQLQAAHTGSLDAQAIYPDPDTQTYIWHDVWYLGTTGAGNSTLVNITIPTGGGARMTLVPDFTPGWVRLLRSDANVGNVTVTAGYEIQGD